MPNPPPVGYREHLTIYDAAGNYYSMSQTHDIANTTIRTHKNVNFIHNSTPGAVPTFSIENGKVIIRGSLEVHANPNP